MPSKDALRIKHQEEKLKELEYRDIGAPALYMYWEYRKEIRQLECRLHIFIGGDKKIRKWAVSPFYPISTQEQLDNLQKALNLLQDDLKELDK